jgi:phosphoribosylaminoimidazolecarboxamide formyltransferase/IMP cyclohydrolase
MKDIDLVEIRRALISVSDKTGLVEFAGTLAGDFSIELISTGGTAKTLQAAGLKVRDVSELTGFPEMFDGRVKTLHPAVHGGLLARRDEPSHIDTMRTHHIQPIDLVVVNFYPFEQAITAAGEAAGFDHALENIDIGGPAMVRSAAKNHRSVVVLTDPLQYEKLRKQLRRHGGATDYRFRFDMAIWAYSRTARYDAAIHRYLAEQYYAGSDLPERNIDAAGLTPVLMPVLRRVQKLRYGENPHQPGAFYADSEPAQGLAAAVQLHGKELSWMNLLDADAALALVGEFDTPAAALIKHANPCGCAISANPADAFDQAYAGDSVAAFGGILALNRRVDAATAGRIVADKRFLEVLLAPDFEPSALDMLRRRWVDCRLLAVGTIPPPPRSAALSLRSIVGGVLVQQPDYAGFSPERCRVVSRRPPTPPEFADLQFAWLVCKHVKSNAIVLAADGQLLSAGAGQTSRVTSCRLAVELARRNDHAAKLARAVAASDAFFPFPDGPEILIQAGVRAIIQPGGSKRDRETIELCDRCDVALVFTGERHFCH